MLQPPKVAPVVPHAPASRGRLCCRGGLTAPYYSHRWLGPAATAASHRSRTSEPSYSSPRGLPLPRLPRLRIIPFLSLAVIHRRGALDAAWSTWSRNDFHRTWTVHGEADNWVHGRSKEVPDTSILHHAFISIFIALWAVITHYISILMAILSYFTRFTMKRGNAGS